MPNLSPAVLAALDAAQIRPAFFVQIVFSTETVWLWTGLGPKAALGPAWDPAATFPYGQIFTGLGWLGQIESIPQTTQVTAENITLTLSGIPLHLLGDAINAVRLSGSATVWLAFLDANNNVIPDPLQLWQGETDVPSVVDGAETCTLSLTVENALIALNLASNRRFTTIDQQLDFPGDAGFDFVTAMQDLFLPYPDATEAQANITGGNLDSAPSYANALTLSPAGPQKLTVGAALNITATAVFVTGPFAAPSGPGHENVTAVGLWSSSDTEVATVSNGSGANLSESNFGTGGGLITAVGPGVCTITFYFGQVSCSITVTVTA
jgi:hypothetical protein